VLPFPPPIWDGATVTLYHGTLESSVTSIVSEVDLRHAHPYQDLGRGFYTTTSLRQATLWAFALARRLGGPGDIAVVAFEVALEDLARLESLAFVRGEYEAAHFWSLVWRCRQHDTHHGRSARGGWYDLVAGPVAADWTQRETFRDYDQISFHTDAATSVLNGSRSWREL
jgi:hypothetical protein